MFPPRFDPVTGHHPNLSCHVDLAPFGPADLARASGRQDRELQGAGRNCLARRERLNECRHVGVWER